MNYNDFIVTVKTDNFKNEIVAFLEKLFDVCFVCGNENYATKETVCECYKYSLVVQSDRSAYTLTAKSPEWFINASEQIRIIFDNNGDGMVSTQRAIFGSLIADFFYNDDLQHNDTTITGEAFRAIITKRRMWFTDRQNSLKKKFEVANLISHGPLVGWEIERTDAQNKLTEFNKSDISISPDGVKFRNDIVFKSPRYTFPKDFRAWRYSFITLHGASMSVDNNIAEMYAFNIQGEIEDYAAAHKEILPATKFVRCLIYNLDD